MDERVVPAKTLSAALRVFTPQASCLRLGGPPRSISSCFRAWLAILLAIAVAGAGAAAGQPEDLRNAATWYRRAFERLEAIPISEAEYEAVLFYIQARDIGEPPRAVREVLDRMEPVFGAIHRGSRQEQSDFALDYAQGFELTLPHLSRLRDVARLMSASASARLAAGDPDTAAAEISSLYRMAGHVGDDDVLISSLVGRVVFEQADRVARSGIDRGVFDAAQSVQLLEGLERLSGDDPFAAIDALRQEKAMLTEWVGKKYAEVADRAKGLGDLATDDSGPDALAGVLLLDQGQFETALEQTGEVLDRSIELFQLDDPGEARLELETLAREIERGDHGALAMLLAPNLAGAYERLAESRDRIATRRTQLLAIAEGLVAPEDLANAALWYLEAIELIQALSPEGLRALRRPDSVDPHREPGAMHLLTLENAAAAIALLETGSRLSRCDFSIARSGPTVIPRYLPPLRDATRLLLLDALRLMLEDEPQQAAERLAVAFRLSAHLAGDGLPVSSLLSHTVFRSTSAFMRGTQLRGLFTAAQHPTLREAVERTSRLDPFGHVSARIEARDEAAAWLRRTVGARAALDEIVRKAHELDGDHLLLVLLVRGGTSDASVDAGPLDDVIAVEAITSARQQAEAIRERLASGDLTVLDEPVEPIARIEKPIEFARFELPRAVHALEAAPTDN